MAEPVTPSRDSREALRAAVTNAWYAAQNPVMPFPDSVFEDAARRLAAVPPAELVEAAKAMRVPADDIRQALVNLRGPVDRDESIVMACAQAILWQLDYPAALADEQRDTLDTAWAPDVADLHAADVAASVAHDYIWQKPVLSGTEPPSKEQASDALWTIHRVLRPLIERIDAAARLKGERP